MPTADTVPRKKWWKIQWYSDDDTPEERKLIVKLDMIVVPYAVLSYWVKYIDQANLNNAYVGGMKEELGFQGNELVELQTMYTVGAVVGMVPFMFLFTYVPMYWTIPAMDILWGLFTLLQYRGQTFGEMAAYRFMVGFFEAAFFPAMHYVFGSWYRGHEIARRGGIFYTGLNLGTLTAGLIAAGATRRLEGVHGMAGWRWMYIICAIITIPVGILGYFLLPGTVDQPNRWVLNDHDIKVAKARLERGGHVTRGKFKLGHIKKIFLSPQFWTVVLVDVLFWNAGIHKSTGTFLLWIKSLGRYTSAEVNEMGTIAPALGILYNIVACFLSDLVLGPAWAITFSSLWNVTGLIILVIWDAPEGAKWFAFATMYWSNALSSVLHGWVNTILRDSPEQRSFTLVMITIIAQSSTAWTPLLTFPTVESPRYPKGFSFCLGCAISLIIATHILDLYIKRKEKAKLTHLEDDHSQEGSYRDASQVDYARGAVAILRRPADFIAAQSRRHNSPIFQIWLGPLTKPAVVVADFREGQDILLRRKEFDRSNFMSSVLSGEANSFHITLKTGPQWKAQRRLLQDLMTPAFLHRVAAPNIYKSALRLVDLWRKKAHLADGKSFSAEHDVFYAALDAVFDFGFGDAAEMRALIPQLEALATTNVEALRNAALDKEALSFPTAPIHPALEATLQGADNIGGVAETGFPRLAWSIIGLMPSVRRTRAVRDKFLVDQVLKASERYKLQVRNAGDEEKHVKSAIDLMVRRLNGVVEKEGHLLPNWIETMRDETSGFIVAGHDTTSTTLCWGLKYMADDQSVQQRLFDSLRSFHSAAATENRLLTHSEICDAKIPYLDAVIEEMLRLAHTAASQDRDCKEDTIILGHAIPKGTLVMVPNKGPSFTEPGYEIDERLRSPSCQKAAKDFGLRVWGSHGMEKFRPERWLIRNENGEDEFNAAAGPTLPFGLGLRGCFGRKLAYMEMKLLVTTLAWSFEFQKCPENLSSYKSITSLTRKPVQCYVRLKLR
ncbi:Cytochrome P450 monooxygenase TRI13 [Colletotrichum sp. SAR11_59]|nr:Cytochrome P450 monooxygenase TRI13 [Colletotrichum sp. SAR11_59]